MCGAELTAAQLKLSEQTGELRRVTQQFEDVKRDKEELTWVQDRRIQEAERVREEAEALRKRSVEEHERRLQLQALPQLCCFVFEQSAASCFTVLVHAERDKARRCSAKWRSTGTRK